MINLIEVAKTGTTGVAIIAIYFIARYWRRGWPFAIAISLAAIAMMVVLTWEKIFPPPPPPLPAPKPTPTASCGARQYVGKMGTWDVEWDLAAGSAVGTHPYGGKRSSSFFASCVDDVLWAYHPTSSNYEQLACWARISGTNVKGVCLGSSIHNYELDGIMSP